MKSSALKTRIPPHLKFTAKVPYGTCRKYVEVYSEVPSFLSLCEATVDHHVEPFFWDYSVEDVAYLISEKWKHPELKEAFMVNNIDGKSLVLLEADRFPKMNITNFDLIKELTAKIRRFCNIEKEVSKRGINLPFRLPYTLYLWFKAMRTGPTSYYATPSKYFRIINIIKNESTTDQRYYELLNHWNRIPSYRPWCPHVTIGGKRRINPMTGTKQRQISYLYSRRYSKFY